MSGSPPSESAAHMPVPVDESSAAMEPVSEEVRQDQRLAGWLKSLGGNRLSDSDSSLAEPTETWQVDDGLPNTTIPAAAGPAITPGTTVGHYEVIRLLGEGGMGAVYLARDTRLGRLVALKFLLQSSALQNNRFLFEARTTAQLSHDHIVALYDIAEYQGMPYMVLEYVPGKTLAVFLRELAQSHHVGPDHRDELPPGVTPQRAAELMTPVVRALVHAHAAHIVHRDLKPANIMLADSGTIKVLDFGIAKLRGEAAGTPAGASRSQPITIEQTDPGRQLGTRTHMSPEQWRGEPVDERADIWAVGVMLYQLVVGEHPLKPITTASLASVADVSRPMPSVAQRRPDIGPLGDIIDRCLRKNKEARMASAAELLAALSSVVEPAGEPIQNNLDTNPYVGLEAFQERDAARFFGREQTVEQVLARLEEHVLVALVGSSGIGKSSLVRAGIIPGLKRRREAWESRIVRPGAHPLGALADLLIQLGSQPPGSGPDMAVEGGEGERAALSARLQLEPGYLAAALRRRARMQGSRILLFVDQLEELVTLADSAESAAFLACLAGAADHVSSPLRVLVSLRQDFLDRLVGSHAVLAERMSQATVVVRPMGRNGLRSALVRPAEAAGYQFESSALVEEMLDALEHTPSALPLLQFTAAQLWELRDTTRRVLTLSSYQALGGIGGALARHAESVVGSMSELERNWARRLMLRLVTPERTRAVVARSELAELGTSPATRSELEQVLARLISGRLLTLHETEHTVEIVHESLIHTWPSLRRWLEQQTEDAQLRSRLRSAAKEWEASGCNEGLLWRGEPAEQAVRFRKRLGAETLIPREERFLSAVCLLTVRQQRRRRRALGAVVVSLLVAVVFAFGLALRARRQALQARNIARLVAARSQVNDPTTALGLLREIEPGPPPPKGWSLEARSALDAGVARVVLRQSGVVLSARFSPDGRHLATGSAKGRVRIFRADGLGQPLVLRGHTSIVSTLAYSPDGKRIVSASTDRTLRVWNADGSGTPVVLRGHDDEVQGAAFSPDGRRIVSASYDKTVRVWNADGSGTPLVLRGHTSGVNTAVFSGDGKRILSASDDQTVRVWNADGSGTPLVLRGHQGCVLAASFDPTNRRIVSASTDKTVRVWYADGSHPPIVLQGHQATVNSAAFSPDGEQIVSASHDKTVRLWNADGSGTPLVLRTHQEWANSASFSADGRWVVSTSSDGTVQVSSVSNNGLRVLSGHENGVGWVEFSPDGRRIVSASYDHTLRVWDADSSRDPIVFRGHTGPLLSARFSPDGKRIASTSYDRTVRLWNTDGSGRPMILQGHQGAVRAVSFSPDGTRIASGGDDHAVLIWNVDGSGTPTVLRGHQGSVRSVEFTADGRKIISASDDHTVRVFSTDGSGSSRTVQGPAAATSDWRVFRTTTGRIVISAVGDNHVWLWDAESPDGAATAQRYPWPGRIYGSRPLTPDDTHLVIGTEEGTVIVIDRNGSGEPLVLHASAFRIKVASFSPDGRRVVAGSDDGKIYLWADLMPLQGNEDPRLWRATSYCMPLEVRQRLLDFPEEQARADLQRCERQVDGAFTAPVHPVE